MIKLIKGNNYIELNEVECPVYNIDGFGDKLRVYNKELYVNRSSNGNTYSLVNLTNVQGHVRNKYRVNNVFIDPDEVKNFWNEYKENQNNVTLIINGAEIAKLSLFEIANKLNISIAEARSIININYSDTLLINRD